MSDHLTSSQPPVPGRASSPRLLLGGTFDPPHIGHLLIAECAHHELGGTVVFLPAGDPWRKGPASPTASSPSAEGPTAASHRLAMTRLAVAGVPHFTVDDREIRRPGPSYTVDTLEELRAESFRGRTLSTPALVLLLGSDAIADMPNWKQPDRIRELATIVEVKRQAGSGKGRAGSGSHAVLHTFPEGLSALSSTLIRARVASGVPITWLVPEAVEAYIQEHGLYRSEQ